MEKYRSMEVNGISVGAKAQEPERYFNQKADYYWRVRDWVLKKDANGKLVNRLGYLIVLRSPCFGCASTYRFNSASIRTFSL
jgi:hypothetical protein